MKTIRNYVYAALLAASALTFVPSAASAQEMAKGKFTLTHDVRWQNAVVPAGEYRFSLDSEGAGGMLMSSRRAQRIHVHGARHRGHQAV